VAGCKRQARRREAISVVKVSIKVRKGASRFAVAVSAGSVQRAVSLVRGRYPGGDCQVLFPVDTEKFLAEDPAAAAAAFGVEQPAGMAA
jgi:hypothetical protein